MFLVLTLAGIVSFFQLGIDANPNIDLPYVTIETTYVGAGPQELETQFTQKVENAVAGLSNVEEIYSGIADGQAYTNVRFALEADGNRALDDVQSALDSIREDLAPYAEAMSVQKLRYDDGAVLTYAVRSSRRSVAELSDWVDRTISPALMAVSGVAEVRRIGGVDREIQVDLDPYRLNAYDLSIAQVNQQIKDFNINLPGGRSQINGQEQSVRAIGKWPDASASLAALENLQIALSTGAAVRLSDLATITDGFAEQRRAATVNQESVVSFGVFRSNGSLLVAVEDGVTRAIAQLQADTLPPDIELQLIFTRATDIREAYKASIEALLLGAILAVVVVGCFLKNWRTTLITAAALPLSIIPTFIVINALGYSLNSMTLLGLTLAVGNLVDDAIVEIENIERHLDMGKSPTQAALDSSAEVGLAVVTTTATIVAVFIPVALMGGIPGQFFKPFGVTVAVSTMFSTLVARFMTPLLASRLLKAKSDVQSGARLNANSSRNSVVSNSIPSHHATPSLSPTFAPRFFSYRKLLQTALRHRLVTIALAVVVFLLSLTLIPQLPTGLYGAGNTDLSHLSLRLPPGTPFAETQTRTQAIGDRILTHPAVESLYLDQQVAAADAVIRLKPKSQRQLSRHAFEQEVRSYLQTLPNLRFNFESQGASGSDKALSIVLKSDNANLLTETANQLALQMQQLPELVDVSTSTGLLQPELLIIPNPQRAADQGVALRDIAHTAAIATLGDTESDLAEIDTGDRQIPIRVRLAEAFRTQLSAIASLNVTSASNQLVPLSAVAGITLSSGPAELTRFDRSRQITVAANLQNAALGQALEAVYALPIFQNLPPGVTQQATGDADILQDVFSRFALALATAIVMIYAVLVLLYNSFIYPLAVMSALPLSIGGTFVALLLTNKPVDLYALIGIVLLMGLVTKNSILLVDYAIQAQQQGLSLKPAVIASGTTRMRPILMTSLSTVAGMVPIALELGAGGEVRAPMAIAVIGGFSTATLLTLIVVPVCFTYIAKLQQNLSDFPKRIAAACTQLFNQLLNRQQPSELKFSSVARPLSLAYAATHAASSTMPSLSSQRLQDTLPISDTSNSSASASAITKSHIPKNDTFEGSFLNSSTSVSSQPSYEPQHRQPPEATEQDAGEHAYTIACIDNDFATLCSLHEYLNDTVFSITSVSDPATALTDLTCYKPDIILLTLTMPGLNGFEVCDRLRKNPFFRKVPIILLSANLTWWQQIKAQWYGATDCIGKPLERTQLLIKLFLLMV